MNQQRRQAAQIGIQRGGQRVARVAAGVGHVVLGGARQTAAVKHGATPVVDAARFADPDEVGQWREQDRGSRQRGAFVAQLEHGGERQSAAGRIAADNHGRGCAGLRANRMPGGYRIVQAGGIWVFRGQPVIGSIDPQSTLREGRREGAMRARRTGEVAAAMQIQDHP